MTSRTWRVGIVGMGFMGLTHAAAWKKAEADGCSVRLEAVADGNPERRRGQSATAGNLETDADTLDLSGLREYDDAVGLLADPDIDIVSICTPTPTHVPLALLALDAGKHVLLEKPVDFDPARIRRLATEAEARKLQVFPAMCMRFWPGWDWLLDAAKSGEYGAIRSASFQRLGSLPNWSRGFYDDFQQSGGALGDLHIHDIDFIHALFGTPDEIEAAGDLLHVSTHYHFPQGPRLVVAEGAWDQQPGTPFRMRYLVNFESATADFELGRDPELQLHRGGESESIPLVPQSGYDGEVRHVIDVLDGRCDSRLTLADAEAVAQTLRRERDSLGL